MSEPVAIRRRRIGFFILNLATLALVLAAMLWLLLAGGMTWSACLIGLGFILTLPYSVLGFWNAAIGLALRLFKPGTVQAMPGVAELTGRNRAPTVTAEVALLMTLRNEAPEPVFERLARMRESLAATGQAERFVFAILSDSDQPEIMAAEAREFDAFATVPAVGEARPLYRRRTHNRGYKAGNIGHFLDDHGSEFDYFVPLDADSLMSGEVIVTMVAAMQAHPEIGILQSLVVGTPSSSGFARIFQFGMRHAMRAVTTGAAWWMADCGSYWGHNAVVRVAPFRAHCRLPELSGPPPLGGAVLSHDQLEAVFMRRAGFEVRVLPVESDSYEINPPTLLDFIRRELRWCQGNMQYIRFLGTPGLRPVSRFQLFQAIGMYIAPAAWMGMIAAACLGAVTGDLHFQSMALGLALFAVVFLLAVAPKIAGVLDVLCSKPGPSRYGGIGVFAASVMLELVSSILIAPVVALSITFFLIGLMFGRRIAWGGQNRSRLGVAWREAWLPLAPHTAAGVIIACVLWIAEGVSTALWAAPVLLGPVMAVPYAVWSARRATGIALRRRRLCLLPEEHDVPLVLARRYRDDQA